MWICSRWSSLLIAKWLLVLLPVLLVNTSPAVANASAGIRPMLCHATKYVKIHFKCPDISTWPYNYSNWLSKHKRNVVAPSSPSRVILSYGHNGLGMLPQLNRCLQHFRMTYHICPLFCSMMMCFRKYDVAAHGGSDGGGGAGCILVR